MNVTKLFTLCLLFCLPFMMNAQTLTTLNPDVALQFAEDLELSVDQLESLKALKLELRQDQGSLRNNEELKNDPSKRVDIRRKATAKADEGTREILADSQIEKIGELYGQARNSRDARRDEMKMKVFRMKFPGLNLPQTQAMKILEACNDAKGEMIKDGSYSEEAFAAKEQSILKEMIDEEVYANYLKVKEAAELSKKTNEKETKKAPKQ